MRTPCHFDRSDAQHRGVEKSVGIDFRSGLFASLRVSTRPRASLEMTIVRLLDSGPRGLRRGVDEAFGGFALGENQGGHTIIRVKRGMVQFWVAASSAAWGWQNSQSGATIPIPRG